MKIRIPILFTGLTIAGALILSSVATALATGPAVAGGPTGRGVCATQATALKDPATVEALRAFGDCEIQRRFTTLDALSTRVSDSKVLTSSDAVSYTHL